jgi:predicted transposase YdaD
MPERKPETPGKKTEEEHKMEYVASWDRDMVRSATKKGLEKGLEKGREKGLAEGLKKGLEKGYAKGLVKKAKETAARMLEDGLPIETTAKYTGLSAAEIKKMAPKSH